ncbi:MAG TPA: elongation factor P maturation arginine rhamnosyltransferase EarP [Azospira sp.]|nr:elongation factor P maturation arginine rhamnosyltransferase EarP [Azospira sp.]
METPARPLPQSAETPLTWDIFCTVVDNYGDIGVCWRLARQLAAEHGFSLRLWVDDLDSFTRLCPELDRQAEMQVIAGVTVRRWPKDFPEVEAAQVVVEAFACELPESYLAAMARASRPPVWINLEYLTAEDWAAHCHGVASPHPRLPLLKYFFFPGFDGKTGGLLRERALIGQRQDFQADPLARQALWQRLGANPTATERVISLFCYGHLPVASLLDVWARAPAPTLCFIPLGPALPEVTAWSGGRLTKAGDWLQQGALRLVLMDFLPQADYDRLLWACDLNFVRGEDSFVRAQWAARPLVWQIYPQEENAHEPKLEAFIAAYSQGLEADAAAALRTFWRAWNGLGEQAAGSCWAEFSRHLPALQAHSRQWSDLQASRLDLAESLARFCRNKL